MEVVRRSQLLAREKAPITTLTGQGALSEAFISSFLRAEKETLEETFLVKEESEFLKPGNFLNFVTVNLVSLLFHPFS